MKYTYKDLHAINKKPLTFLFQIFLLIVTKQVAKKTYYGNTYCCQSLPFVEHQSYTEHLNKSARIQHTKVHPGVSVGNAVVHTKVCSHIGIRKIFLSESFL